jgi:DNA-binding NtrC family response regulator
LKTLREIEREHIALVLDNTETLDEAAEVLGINIVTLYRKRVEYGLPVLEQWSGRPYKQLSYEARPSKKR